MPPQVATKTHTVVIFVNSHSNVFRIIWIWRTCQSARTISVIALVIERTAYNSDNEIEQASKQSNILLLARLYKHTHAHAQRGIDTDFELYNVHHPIIS